MDILVTAQRRGSVNALVPLITELQQRGHKIKVYGTGKESEAESFGERIQPAPEDYASLVYGYDAVVVGMSGIETPDGCFLKAANAALIPTVAVQDQNIGYAWQLQLDDLPTHIAVMNEACLETMRTELGEEAAARGRVVGWAAFDHYAALLEAYSEEQRSVLLQKIGLSPEQKLHLYLSQNIHPDTAYLKPQVEKNGVEYRGKLLNQFKYERHVTQKIFAAAVDCGIKLAVRPHPGENYNQNYTLELAKKFSLKYVPAEACPTLDLMLASDTIFAGRSTALTKGCLLDKNTGGIIPKTVGGWVKVMPPLSEFPPLQLQAIPYTEYWSGIGGLVQAISRPTPNWDKEMAAMRKKFSVDGKSSQRLADLIESLR